MRSDAPFEVTKEWLESFSIEEGTADCSAGVLSLSDLIHFAEPDPIDETPEADTQVSLHQSANHPVSTRQSVTATTAPAKSR